VDGLSHGSRIAGSRGSQHLFGSTMLRGSAVSGHGRQAERNAAKGRQPRQPAGKVHR